MGRHSQEVPLRLVPRDDNYYGEGQQAKCTTVNPAAFEAFRDAFRYKGRERIPAENLQPGM